MGNITVNRLPVPTWNSLRVNDAVVKVADEYAKTAPEVVSPAQVKVTKMPVEKANALLESKMPQIPREAIVAGKQPVYMGQRLATGLGGDLTAFADEKTCEVTVFEVPENTSVSEPVLVKLKLDAGNYAEQYAILVGDSAEATFLFVREGENETDGQLLSSVRLFAGKNAKARVIDVNLAGNGFSVLDDYGASLDEKAEFELTQLLLGADKTYTGCRTDQFGNGSKFIINTGYLAQNGQELDINYHTFQRGKNTESNINVKGSLRTGAVKTFRGTIDFRKGSVGSTGDEQEDVLLFDDDVVNKTIPVILTEEEDVKGRHGGSMGNLAKDMLFYMGTRGIDKIQAEMLVTKGRLVKLASSIPHEETIGRINGFIREAFK